MARDAMQIGPRRTLRRVVPIAQTDNRGGLALTLVTLEAYSDGVEVRCLLQPGEGHPIRELASMRDVDQAELRARFEALEGKPNPVAPMVIASGSEPDQTKSYWPEPVWSVRDDRGNDYQSREFGGGEFQLGEFRISYTFAPALDRRSRTLQFDVAEIAWTTLPPRRDDGSPRRTDTGPWSFAVDLTAGREVERSGAIG